MGFYIRKVKINSLFVENNDLSINFKEKTNCIFGDNGTGKTTVINLIVAILKCEVKTLNKIPFRTAEILTAARGTLRARKCITVQKTNEDEITYEIHNENIKETFSLQADNRINYKKRDRVLTSINNILQLTYVPLNRMNNDEATQDTPEEYYINRSLRARHMANDEIMDIIDPSRRMLSLIEKEFINRYADMQNKISADTEEMRN